MVSKFFTTHKIDDSTTVITGISGENAFLVCGNEKALLIDTLYGVGSLKTFCKELTDLPIIVVNTHGHVDHVGCNAEFERVYMHPLDIDMSYFQMTIVKKVEILTRDGFMNVIKERHITPEDYIKEKSCYVIPVYEGEYFDLGGKTIEVIHIPGHSRGSIALLNVEDRVVFTGDSIAPGTLMYLENSTSIKDYYDSMVRFKEISCRFDKMYWSHSLECLSKDCINDTVDLCESILNGNDDAVPYPTHPFYWAKEVNDSFKRVDGKWANIRYNKNYIFEKERSGKIVDYPTRSFNMYD